MAKLYNLARMTTATTGTGTITLGAAVSGFLTFAQAGAANGDVVAYGISDGANSEVGTGTYTASGTTLSRTPSASTNAGSAITLSGTAQVYITARAEDLNVLPSISASLGANVALSNTGLYFDGPSVAQGTVGTWFVTGTVTLQDVTGSASFQCKLYDGTTTIASGAVTSSGNLFASCTLSGIITNPAGNLRIAVLDPNTTTGLIIFNRTGLSKDSTITAVRIG